MDDTVLGVRVGDRVSDFLKDVNVLFNRLVLDYIAPPLLRDEFHGIE
jgi:hypothetical protein